MNGALLETQDLVKHFPLTRSVGDFLRRKTGDVIHAVDSVSLDLFPPENMGMNGESG